MSNAFLSHIGETLTQIEADGLYKRERMITSPQGGEIRVGARNVINLCANNYLGLADHPDLIAAAKTVMDDKGYGMASVRFICGTQDLHRELEQRIAKFLGKDDSILFAACFDANGGLFEPLLGPEDAIVSDSLNHASIIDGIRLCKAQRYRYANNDMMDLEAKLKDARAAGARHVMVATDGVFSMDGYLANLPAIREIADRYDAVVMVDDCHATGFMGPHGAGMPDHFGVDVDILTGTLGKALGGDLRKQLFENAKFWREGLTELGFDLLPGEHPIIPVMLGDAKLAQAMATKLFDEGVYVSGFFFPVVPKGQARIRTQMNAALTREELTRALGAFERAGKACGVI